MPRARLTVSIDEWPDRVVSLWTARRTLRMGWWGEVYVGRESHMARQRLKGGVFGDDARTEQLLPASWLIWIAC